MSFINTGLAKPPFILNLSHVLDDMEVFCDNVSGVIPCIWGWPKLLSLNRCCHVFCSLISLKTETLDWCPSHGAELSSGKFPEVEEEKKKKWYLAAPDKPRGSIETPDATSAFRKRDPVTESTRGRSLPSITLFPPQPPSSQAGLSSVVLGGTALPRSLSSWFTSECFHPPFV